ncbi:cysteine desulfurase [Salipaludibacillus keqinensis]|uniref:cysteine desulfurase n=1 Tax=Salipaludibacillus keqinensis TaxID=2045207 RepID=A0A323T9H9_9BACI|nr:aminotransferase class V-fold PLP-dependent enzyme [Salipaludibacillus keqinensis]PYZ91790.1 cysteine desulfurase [Salipaludibacillus keqinensis]
MIYFDQAASSFPKPPAVAKAMAEAVNDYGANPGRSGHQLSQRASGMIDQTRMKLQKMFRNQSSDRVVFSLNATTALNQAIQGISWEQGDRVISTAYEHNSVRRPLERVKAESGVEIDYVRPTDLLNNWVEAIESKLTERTKLVVVTHGSNVTGEMIPIQSIGSLLKDHPALFCVDASQTAGVVPINMVEMNIDMLAFPGHKGLLGPQGVGVLMVGNDVNLKPIIVGGTGTQSETPNQPAAWPVGWESGTLNTPGIVGLLKGLEEVERRGMIEIYEHEKELTLYCLEGLNRISDVHIVGPKRAENRLGVVSFNISDIDGNEIAMILDQHYGVAVRAGLHCSPLTHEFLGTIEKGLIRVSFGPYNTKEEVDTFLNAMKEIKESLLE